jgi:Protein of unknown function (DUF2971)
MTSIFHYTTPAGLLGILSSGSLFATDYRFLNDASEGAIIKQFVLPTLEAEAAAVTTALLAKGIAKNFYKDHGEAVHRLQAEQLYRVFMTAVNNSAPFFVVSFCRHDEGTEEYANGLLSQWRGYGESGGFAIEFDEELIDQLVHREMSCYAYLGFKSCDVTYAGAGTKFDTLPYKGVAAQMIKIVFAEEGIDISDVAGNKDLNEAAVAFFNQAPFLKHWGFHEENEFRVSVLCLRAKAVTRLARPLKPIKLRTKGSSIIFYIELFSGFDEPLPIKSIIVGPHAHQARQAEALHIVAETTGLNFTVRLSGIPFQS